MSAQSTNLKRNLSRAFDLPNHVAHALATWVDHIEEALAGSETHRAPDEGKNDDVDGDFIDRLDALELRLAGIERTVAEIHAALSSSPAPATVQRAMADVDPPTTSDSATSSPDRVVPSRG